MKHSEEYIALSINAEQILETISEKSIPFILRRIMNDLDISQVKQLSKLLKERETLKKQLKVR